jgi:acetyl-CoA decarbonylase/synthase complex subunit epsilon
MSAKMRTGQTAEIPGPKKAIVIPKPKVAVSMIKRAERPLLVVGSKAPDIETNDGDLVDSAIRFLKTGVTVVATGHLSKTFRDRGVEVYSMQFMNLGDRLRDPGWSGFDGKGPYDLVLFVGTLYYMEWLVQSGLKSFAQDLRTVSLGNAYQPNASWSMGSSPRKNWLTALDEIIKGLEEENR